MSDKLKDSTASPVKMDSLRDRIAQTETSAARLKRLIPPPGSAIPNKQSPPNKLGARKHAGFKAISTAPSINLTPAGASMVPAAYPTVQDLSSSVGVASSVNFNGCPVYLLNASTQPACKGDEAGTGGGIRSGTVNGEVKPVKGSSTVRIEGKQVIREGDPCTMNGGNNPGVYVTVPATSDAPPKSAIASSNPLHPVAPVAAPPTQTAPSTWDAKNPLGLDLGSQADQLAAAMQKDALNGNAAVRRSAQLLLQKPDGPMLVSRNMAGEAQQQLRTKNNLEIALLGIFAVPGVLTRAFGGSEERVAASNEVGAAGMGVAWSVAGFPNRAPISVGRRVIAKPAIPTVVPRKDGVKIIGGFPPVKKSLTATPKFKAGFTEKDILGIPHGSRPNPEIYLEPKYIEEHLREFKDHGGGFIFTTADISNKKYPTFNPNKFLMSGSDLDSVVFNFKNTGNLTELENSLGYDPGYLSGKDIYMMKIPNPKVVMPTGNESGANSLWRPAGLTFPGGMKEAVLDNVPIAHNNDINKLLKDGYTEKIP
jgi:uncharacterized Zn-binding protein involved in type VI secretion